MTQITENPKLKVIHGEVYASSIEISDKFRVDHHNVLRAITKRLGQLKSEFANDDFANTEFIETTYQDAGNHPRKMYLLTEEGFAMSVFLFKTKEALIWQVNYIRAFKAMKATLLKQALDKIRWRYADDQFLPFGTDVVRKSLSTAYAAEYCRVRGWLPNMTTSKLNDLIKAEKVAGRFVPRNSIVYVDSFFNYLNSLGIFPNANEIGGAANV